LRETLEKYGNRTDIALALYRVQASLRFSQEGGFRNEVFTRMALVKVKCV